MKRLTRLLIVLLICGALLSGAWCSLAYLRVVPVPGFLRGVPVFSKIFREPSRPETGLTPAELENRRLQREISDLKRKKADLEKRVTRAESGQRQAGDRLAELEQQLKDIKKANASTASREKTFKKLAQYYASVKAKNAAEVFNRLDDETVIGILQNMDPDDAANIMAAMPPERTAVITRKMLQAR